MTKTQTVTENYEIVRVESDEEELVFTGSIAAVYDMLEGLREELSGADDNYKVQPAQA